MVKKKQPEGRERKRNFTAGATQKPQQAAPAGAAAPTEEKGTTKTDSKPSSPYQGDMAPVRCPKLGDKPRYPGAPEGPGIALGNWAPGKNTYRCITCGELHPAIARSKKS